MTEYRKKCPRCGLINDADAIFCSDCGYKIPKPVPEVESVHKSVLTKVVIIAIILIFCAFLYLETVTPTITITPTVVTNPTTMPTTIDVTNTPMPSQMLTPTSQTPIISYIAIFNSYPKDKVINSSVDEQMTFSITTSQPADITWRLNDIKVQYTSNSNTSSYTNPALFIGMFIVNATADTSNGSISRKWIWNITKVR